MVLGVASSDTASLEVEEGLMRNGGASSGYLWELGRCVDRVDVGSGIGAGGDSGGCYFCRG